MSWFDHTHEKEQKKNEIVNMRSLMRRQNTIAVDLPLWPCLHNADQIVSDLNYVAMYDINTLYCITQGKGA